MPTKGLYMFCGYIFQNLSKRSYGMYMIKRHLGYWLLTDSTNDLASSVVQWKGLSQMCTFTLQKRKDVSEHS